MNSTMEAIYRKIELEGVWLVDPKQTTREQQDAILALRKAGKIEQAAYGGLKVKRDWRVKGRVASVQPSPGRDVVARFAALGIVSEKPIVEAHGMMKRPGTQPSYVIVLPKGKRIPASAWSELADGAYSRGNLYVVQFKKGA